VEVAEAAEAAGAAVRKDGVDAEPRKEIVTALEEEEDGSEDGGFDCCFSSSS
jgi:hypothetical protein